MSPTIADSFGRAFDHYRAGRLDEAERACRAVLAGAPCHPAVFHLLAVTLATRQRFEPAARLMTRAIALDGGNPDYHDTQGVVLLSSGRLDQAAAAFRRAGALAPEAVEYKRRLALVEMKRGHLAAAAAALAGIVVWQPDDAAAVNDLAGLYLSLGRHDAAVAVLRMAVALQPEVVGTRANLGNALRMLGRCDEAIVVLRGVLAADPGNAFAQHNLGLSLLAAGQLAEGARYYELGRFGGKPPTLAGCPAVPKWDGRPMPDGTLLVQFEQGLGDAIQLVRYLPLVAQRVGRIALPYSQPLTRLFEALPEVSLRSGPGEAMAVPDAFVPILSLLAIFTGSAGYRTGAVPYLSADPDAAAGWRERLATGEGLRVGLVWAGNPHHYNDRNRSCPLPVLRPLLDVPGVAFHSLQKGARAGDLAASGLDGRIRDLGPDIADLADVAAAMAALDLVVTVDTATAHLAGALGVPVWVLLPKVADYRWESGERTPWYPTMRLFRQHAAGEWGGVVSEIGAALRDYPRLSSLAASTAR